MLIMNIVLEIDDPEPNLYIRINLVPTLKFTPIFIKFSTHNKSNMLIMNIKLAIVQSARVIIGLEWLQAQNDYRLENSTQSKNMIYCFNSTLKVIKTCNQIVIPKS